MGKPEHSTGKKSLCGGGDGNKKKNRPERFKGNPPSKHGGNHRTSGKNSNPNPGNQRLGGRGGGGEGRNNQKKRKSIQVVDPSMQYIKSPVSTPVINAAKTFFSGLSIPFKVHIGPLTNWRTVAKLAVRGSGEEGKKNKGKIKKDACIGLFKIGTHEIVPCFDSPAHHSSINEIALLVESAAIQCGTTGYREDTDAGMLRYLLFAVERATGKVQLTMVLNREPPLQQPGKGKNTGYEGDTELARLTQRLISFDPNCERLHSIWFHYNPASKHNNAITGRMDHSWRCIHGTDLLREVMPCGMEEACGVFPRLCFPPNVFRQANLEGFANIIRTIRSYVPRDSKVMELYGGVGTIGLNCLDLVNEIQCSDENPYNKSCFEKALSEIGNAEYRRKATYLSTAAANRAKDLKDFDLAIVDPPRKGLEDEVVDALTKIDKNFRLRRLIYVSCGFKAFEKNCEQILRQRHSSFGGSFCHWKIVYAEGHVLFPGSDHIETLAIFDRVD